MKQIRSETCYWGKRARELLEEREKYKTYEECYTCNGHDKECRRYFGIIETWPMTSDEWPYEEISQKSHNR